MEHLQYPVGKFLPKSSYSAEDIKGFIQTLEGLPGELDGLLQKATEEQLDTPYRPGGWTVRQVIHHLADSHMNAYIRMKLAYTEEHPTIKPYEEKDWAETKDSRTGPVDTSAAILIGLHARWTFFLKSLSENDFARTVYHPENKRDLRIDSLMALYAWHCGHHLAHIRLVTG